MFFFGRKKDEEGDEVRGGGRRPLFVCSEQKQSHSRDRGTLADPYRGDRLEVSYGGRCCCGGCGCGACCIGHPGREVNGPALKALRSHLHRGTKVGGGGSAGRWLSLDVWLRRASLLLLPLTRDHKYNRHPLLKSAHSSYCSVNAAGPPRCRNRPLSDLWPPSAGAASHSAVPMFNAVVKMHWQANLARQGSCPGLSISWAQTVAALGHKGAAEN